MDDVPARDDAEPSGPPCPGCGRTRTATDAVGVAWSSHRTADGLEFVCPDCTRADLADIEAGLAARPEPARQRR